MSKSVQTSQATVAERFEAQLFDVARTEVADGNWAGASEPSWTEPYVIMDPDLPDLPADVLNPQARTMTGIARTWFSAANMRIKAATIAGTVIFAGALWAFFGPLYPWPESMAGWMFLIVIGALVAAYGIGSPGGWWRQRFIRQDAQNAIQTRTPYLNQVIAATTLSEEAWELLESFRTVPISVGTKWEVAQMLLAVDEDRRELNHYRKFLPETPGGENQAHPLYEVLGKIQDRINTRMHAIATKAAADSHTVDRHERITR